LPRKSPELAIVIPVFNEEEVIEQVLERWTQVLDSLPIEYQIHIYDDGSTDQTPYFLQKWSDRSQIFLHHHPNRGHGPTILRGYRENTDKEWILQIDSDGEQEADDFSHFWKNRLGQDLVIGNRKQRKGPLVRNMITLISGFLTKLLFKANIRDVNCPYRLMRSKAFSALNNQVPMDTFAPNILISGYSGLKKLRVLELDVRYKDRPKKKNKLNGLNLTRAVIRSTWQTLYFRWRAHNYG